MLANHLFLPIYDDINSQFGKRANCDGKEFNTFLYPNFIIPGFFFTREKRPNTINHIYIYNVEEPNTVVAEIPIGFMQAVSSATYDGFGVPTQILSIATAIDNGYDNLVLPCGDYYLALEEAATGNRYYSEVFQAVEAVGLTDDVELISNGRFSAVLVGWGTSGTWSASGNKATYAGGGSGFILDQSFSNANADGAHLYKFTCTITSYDDSGDNTRYIRIYTNGIDGLNSVKITGDGNITGYVNKASRILVETYGGEVTFDITDISLQKLVGYENYLTINAWNDCKFPNSIDSDNYFYSNLILLETVLLAPDYGEKNVQDENGNLEDLNSFVRAFKSHNFTTKKVPAPVVDALAQLNAFDEVEILDGANPLDYFRLNSEERITQVRSILPFTIKPQWQEGECYALVDVTFEENLAIKSECCDDSEILPCFDTAPSIAIALTQTFNTGFHIALSGTPATDADGAFVRLLVGKVPVADYTNCGSASPMFVDSGLAKTYADFIANGFDITANDQLDYVYVFYITISQIGCTGTKSSSNVCATKPLLVIDQIGDECNTTLNRVFVDTSITLYTGVVIEFFVGGLGGGWNYATSVSDGSNTLDIDFGGDAGAITQARLRADNGDVSANKPYVPTLCS